MKEIGSEFWLAEQPRSLKNAQFPIFFDFGFDCDTQFLYSGRTAIDFVLDDIQKKISKVYMPSYCCESMIKPFSERNLEIIYYDVYFLNGNIEYNLNFKQECDIFFATSYFGFSSSIMDSSIKLFKNNGAIIIEDITHRLLSKKNYCKESDYLIASLRKWFEIPSGGIAIKRRGYFNNKNLKSSDELVITKIQAMEIKRRYIYEGAKNDKQTYMKLFKAHNESLNKDIKNYQIDSLSKKILSQMNIESNIRRRQENARVIYNLLKETDNIKFVFDKFDPSNDCPLFIPLKVNSLIRNELRNMLVSNQVYCPIHWPKPSKSLELNELTKKIYEEELSLVCDQRYDFIDMERMLELIKDFRVML